MNKLLGRMIEYHRKEKGINQEKLAKKINKSRITIGTYENGAIPSLKTQIDLSEALNHDFTIYNDDQVILREVYDPIEILTHMGASKGKFFFDFSHDIEGRENMHTVFELENMIEAIYDRYFNKKEESTTRTDTPFRQRLNFFHNTVKDIGRQFAPVLAELRKNKIKVYIKNIAVRMNDLNDSCDEFFILDRSNNPIYQHKIGLKTMIFVINDNSNIYNEINFTYNEIKKKIVRIPKYHINKKLEIYNNQEILFTNDDLLYGKALDSLIEYYQNSFSMGYKSTFDDLSSEYNKGKSKTKEMNIFYDKYWGAMDGEPSRNESYHPLSVNYIEFDYVLRELEQKYGNKDYLQNSFWDPKSLEQGMKIAKLMWSGYLATMLDKNYKYLGYFQPSRDDRFEDFLAYQLEQLEFSDANVCVEALIESNEDFKKYMIETKQIEETVVSQGGK